MKHADTFQPVIRLAVSHCVAGRETDACGGLRDCLSCKQSDACIRQMHDSVNPEQTRLFISHIINDKASIDRGGPPRKSL